VTTDLRRLPISVSSPARPPLSGVLERDVRIALRRGESTTHVLEHVQEDGLDAPGPTGLEEVHELARMVQRQGDTAGGGRVEQAFDDLMETGRHTLLAHYLHGVRRLARRRCLVDSESSMLWDGETCRETGYTTLGLPYASKLTCKCEGRTDSLCTRGVSSRMLDCTFHWL